MKELLEKLSKSYYEGNPLVSDEEFDSLVNLYGYKKVGYTVTDGVPHMWKMWSLQKCFDLSNPPLELPNCIETPKLDGAAVSLLFIQGELQQAITRGNGKVGKDCTQALKHLIGNVNIEVPWVYQVTGEVVCPSSVKNARNVAAGSLNLKSLEEFKTRPLKFVAYDIQGAAFSTYTEAMLFLESKGLNTVLNFNSEDYPTDGRVFRLESYRDFFRKGYTSHHPKGAFAYKEQKEGHLTKLLDVIWQVGKSGAVSPVAVLEPVLIDDASVSRASLHNIQYIQGLKLEIGCTVEVIRSGDIIPRVVRRVD